MEMIRLILFIYHFCALRLVSCSNFDITAIRGCLPSMTYFREWYDVTLKQCVIECSMRERCTYITYRPTLFRLCRLSEGTFPGYVTSDAGKGTCIYVRREDIETDMAAICSCQGKETCRPATGECFIEECDNIPELLNGITVGNMNNVGSGVKVVCNDGYTEVRNLSYVQCNADGTWSNVPYCTNGNRVICDETCDNSTYLIVTETSNRSDASNTCESTGGYLAKITTVDEHRFLVQQISHFSADFWIGLEKDNGIWKWTDMSIIDYTKWMTKEPDGSGDCARMKHDAFTWADWPCSARMFYICEYSAQ